MPPKSKEKQENQHIQVAVRLRPINSTERKQGSYSVADASSEKREVTVKERLGVNPTTKTFNFDHVFTQDSKQQQVYRTVVSPIIKEVLSGYNCTIFAYGQTGTGKTFTMEGERSPDPNLSWEQDPLTGIIPRALANIFDNLQSQQCEFSVRVSFLELYNEELFDLLGSCDDPLRLKIYEDSTRKGSVIIQGLEEIVVKSKDEVYEILERGASRRQTACTLLNAFSSRSHSVFTVTIHTKENTMEGEELLKTGKLHLVDLAGSENIGRSGAVDKRAREAGNINQSLLTLGRVITALVEHAPHIPYRESKLTRILQDSLGGRTKTSIIATISPASVNLEETLSTLDYAHRAKNITNRPEVNQKLTKKALIKEYTEELDKLRRDLQAAREKNGFFIAQENYNAMQQKLTVQDDTIEELTTRIEAMTEELTKVQELFTETQEELEQTTDQLTVTKDKLVKTKVTLRETKVNLKTTELDRDGHKFLAGEIKKSEDELYDTATHLLSTLDDAMSDVSGLHDKVGRLKKVEADNKETLDSYEQSFAVTIGDMEQQIQQYSSQQTQQYQQHSRHIAEKITRNSGHVDILTSQMRELQSSLTQHLKTLTDHTKASCEQNTAAVNSLNTTAADKMKVEIDLLNEVESVIERFAGVMSQITNINTIQTDLAQLSQTQREENEAGLRTWMENMTDNLARIEETVSTHTSAQSQQIAALQLTTNNLTQQFNNTHQAMEEKLSEVTQLHQNNSNTVRQMSSSVETESDALSRQTGALLSDVKAHREECGTKNQSSLDHMIAKHTEQCHMTHAKLGEIEKLADVTRTDCTGIQTDIQMHMNTGKSTLEQYVNDVSESCTRQLTDFNTQLNTQYKHSDSVQSAAQTQCDHLVGSLDKHSAAFDREVTMEKTTRTSQEELTSHFSQDLLSRLEAHMKEMKSYIKDKISEDLPTGQTPVVQEFPHKRNMRRISNQQKLLDKFLTDNAVEMEEEADSDLDQDTENQEPSEDGNQDNSDAISVKSSTSGISDVSSYSAFSNASKVSECKENERLGRPLGSKKPKCKQQNFNNVTPRAKTRLPLRQQGNNQTQKTSES